MYLKIENIVEKEENVGYQHYFLFPQCFQKISFSSIYSRIQKVGENLVVNW